MRPIAVSSDSATASIAPEGVDCISRPRAATMVNASSRTNTPARHAATSSPRLWPIIAAGLTPHDSQRQASAYSTTNRAGWATAVSVSQSAADRAGDVASSNSRRSNPSDGARNAQHPST